MYNMKKRLFNKLYIDHRVHTFILYDKCYYPFNEKINQTKELLIKLLIIFSGEERQPALTSQSISASNHRQPSHPTISHWRGQISKPHRLSSHLTISPKIGQISLFFVVVRLTKEVTKHTIKFHPSISPWIKDRELIL